MTLMEPLLGAPGHLRRLQPVDAVWAAEVGSYMTIRSARRRVSDGGHDVPRKGWST